MNFLIYDRPGFEPGRITQSSKVFNPLGEDGRKSYYELLDEQGMKYHAIDRSSALPLDWGWVNSSGELCERVPLPIVCTTPLTIKVGEAIKLEGMLKPSRFTLYAGGFKLPVHDEVVNLDILEIEPPTVGSYRVVINCWPYIDWDQTINVVAAS